MTKEECLQALDILKVQHDYLCINLNANYPYTIEMIDRVQKCFEKLIKEHFELKEVLKKYKLDNLTNNELGFMLESMWEDVETVRHQDEELFKTYNSSSDF